MPVYTSTTVPFPLLSSAEQLVCIWVRVEAMSELEQGEEPQIDPRTGSIWATVVLRPEVRMLAALRNGMHWSSAGLEVRVNNVVAQPVLIPEPRIEAMSWA